MDQHHHAFSVQFLNQLQRTFRLDTIIGMHPLNAPNTFPTAWLDGVTKEGWTHQQDAPRRPLLIIPKSSKNRTLPHLQLLTSALYDGWLVLAQLHGLPKPLSAWLTNKATLIHTLPKGSLILQYTNSWTNGSYKTRGSRSVWALWASPTLAAHPREPSWASFHLDRHGIPLDTTIPYEHILYGPHAEYLRRDAVLAATDGSVQPDGTMGSSATAADSAFDDQLCCVTGNPSSTKAEIEGIAMATAASPQTRPLVIFTDSLTTLRNLLQRQRKDTAPSNTPPSIDRQLTSLIQASTAGPQNRPPPH